MTLSKPIAAFFQLSKRASQDELKHVFSDTAHIIDEQKDHVGFPDIATWWRETNEKTPFESVPMKSRTENDLIIVTAEVSGSFPGSPIMLDHRFRVKDDKVVELEIK